MGNSITQKLKYKQSVIKFSYKYGVTKASIKFKENRRTIYRWRERYDGTLESLKDKSRRPHTHPNEQTEEEIKMIKNYKANNKETGLVVLWIKLRNAGYRRSVTSLYRVMIKLGIYNKSTKKKERKECRILSRNDISRREDTNRCKICSKEVFKQRIARKGRKILSIYSNR